MNAGALPSETPPREVPAFITLILKADVHGASQTKTTTK